MAVCVFASMYWPGLIGWDTLQQAEKRPHQFQRAAESQPVSKRYSPEKRFAMRSFRASRNCNLSTLPASAPRNSRLASDTCARVP